MMQALLANLRMLAPRPLVSSWERLKSSAVGYRLARGAFWSLMGTVASRSTGLLSAIILARILGKTGYGQLGMIQSTVTTFATFAGFGMGLTAAKHVAEYRRVDPARAGRIMGLSSLVAWGTGALMTLVCVASAGLLASRTLADPHLKVLLQLSAPLLLLGAVNGAQVGALNGFEAFRAIAKNNLITGLVSVPLSVVGVLAAGLYGVVIAQVIAGAFGALLNFQVLRRQAQRDGVPFGYRDCFQERTVIWRFSLPALLSSVALAPLMWVANVLLVNTPSGYEKMATLSAAGQWTSLLLFLPNTIMQAVLPIFSASVADTSDVKAFAKTLNLTQSLMVLIAFPCCTALMFSADWLMGVYWKTTAGESVVLIACLLASLIQCLGAAAGPAIQAKSRMWFAFAINLSWGVIYVAFTAVFVGALGATAVAFGQVVAYFLGTIWVFLYIRSDLPAGLLSRILLGLIFACFIAALCLATPAPMRIWLALPATLAATVAALHSLINPELRKDIRTALIWSKLRS